jgi:hypothetical protein
MPEGSDRAPAATSKLIWKFHRAFTANDSMREFNGGIFQPSMVVFLSLCFLGKATEMKK